ncbi:MAG: sigma-70 family RNA polymerase sigma factor [Bacteroidota bacterium]
MNPSPLFLSTDARILDSIRRGNEDGLVTLIRSCRRQVTALVLRNNGTMDDADDVLQDAVIVLWERVRAGRYTYAAKLETFVYATARNLWLRRLARTRREAPGLPPDDHNVDESDSTLDRMIESEEAALVHVALERLGEPCRTLLLLFYWEERSMGEIAVELGFANADTAKSKKYQCKKALEKLLAPYRDDGKVS